MQFGSFYILKTHTPLRAYLAGTARQGYGKEKETEKCKIMTLCLFLDARLKDRY